MAGMQRTALTLTLHCCVSICLADLRDASCDSGQGVVLLQTGLDATGLDATGFLAPLRLDLAAGPGAERPAAVAEDIVLLAREAVIRNGAREFDPFDQGVEDMLSGNASQIPVQYSGDIWHGTSREKTRDVGFSFFKAATPWEWCFLAITCVVLCLFDFLVLQRFRGVGLRGHLATLLLWIVVAAIFNFVMWLRLGPAKALDWCSGYLLEWMLSMDNLFVFHLVFQAYKVPGDQLHKALFVGIVGAIVLRMLFFMVVGTLLHALGWIRWPFGALLVWSGIEAARSGDEDDDDLDVENSRLIYVLRCVLGNRLHEAYNKAGALIQVGTTGKLQVTMLLVVVFCLELSDLMFALDSVSAKVAQIPDQYIAFSSSVLAMYGLRAMFFIIQDLVEMFDLLKYGLCLILVFIGVELMFAKYIRLPSSTVLIVILAVFAVSMAGSWAKKQLGETKEPQHEEAPEDSAPAAQPAPDGLAGIAVSKMDGGRWTEG